MRHGGNSGSKSFADEVKDINRQIRELNDEDEQAALCMGVCSKLAKFCNGNIAAIRCLVAFLILISGIVPGIVLYLIAGITLGVITEDEDDEEDI